MLRHVSSQDFPRYFRGIPKLSESERYPSRKGIFRFPSHILFKVFLSCVLSIKKKMMLKQVSSRELTIFPPWQKSSTQTCLGWGYLTSQEATFQPTLNGAPRPNAVAQYQQCPAHGGEGSWMAMYRYTGWLIGIVLMVYHNPYING